MRYWTELLNNVLLPFIILIFGFTVVSQFPAETLFWLNGKSWLPYVAIGISLLLALQFNHSRLVYAAGFWSLLLFSLDKPDIHQYTGLTTWMLLPLVASCLGVLIWKRNKAVRPYNVLKDIALFIAVAVATFTLLTWQDLQSNNLYQNWANTLYQWLPHWRAQFSTTEILLFAILLLVLLVRMLTQASLGNSLLASMIVMMFILQLYENNEVLRFASLLFSVASSIVVLFDSHNMAFKDDLTGIASRRALIQFTRAIGNNYSIVMADVDHFKSFNDTYGHDVGDQVLKMVAQQLNRVSKGGKAYRYGGEEFTLVFPGKNPEQVFDIVDELRESIANYPMVIRQAERPDKKPKKKDLKQPSSGTQQKVVHVTMSFGIAFKDKQSTFDETMKSADQLLYKAKKAGRNNVQK
ncbi:GGDEF domain-containing protein [Paraneptunicella aestuarii]|uniref:GGDEF domain-containing protein n=1 Tax=Paraneptunicella aestuarii TaxID=2831148 RepID=UPI001E2F209A|nr:GGDEF domain-containing protein [Paraneptunicella aestuarii]UAA40248.1 GGDEF domain-containing protein [Paraneptunicella aestuarii]